MSESYSLPTEPEGIVASLVERFNSGKVSAMMGLYAPEAVFIAKDGRTITDHTEIAADAFIYATVLEGAIRSQVNDGPVTTYKAGESFSELPGDRHAVSANASDTEPAKLLAVVVVDTNETELTIPFGK
jgi:quercetin dioxygenase-like cupin family protein